MQGIDPVTKILETIRLEDDAVGGACSTDRLTIAASCATAHRMDHRLDHVFAALADPTRRRILALLLEDDMAVSDVAQPFGVSLAAISKHLAVLDRAGLVDRERRGRVTWCKLQTEALREASVWITCFGLLEPLDLEGFERFLRAQGLEDETDDGDDDDDDADDVDDLVHDCPP
jgi:DNA-binding transcriptional ArsR family regulator